ncbi:MAG TPA: hypothetical protein VIJ94_12680 [Caulobacteraceae bacterium]
MRALALTLAVALAAGAASAAPTLNSRYADPAQPDISGIWQVTGWFSFSADKAIPKLRPPYDGLYAKRTTAFNAGKPIDDVTADCLPPGMPHIQVVPYPFEIMQTPGRVTMLFEYAGQVRRIYLDGGQPKEPDPTYYGTSVGRWDGDTLVVTTNNIREDTQDDFSGLPHSDALTITERFHRTAPDTLEDRITLDDPKAYAEPFTSTRVYKLHPAWTIGEYVCEENNRNQIQANGVTGFGVPTASK